jgi:hypothetical protein
MQVVRIVGTLDDAVAHLGGAEEWVTSARDDPAASDWTECRAAVASPGAPVLITFGTGWGLAPAVLDRAARRVAPVRGCAADGYNHLSVRAAAAIVLDRIFACRDPQGT